MGSSTADAPGGAGGQGTPAAEPLRARVLVVEDELIIAWQLSETIQELGHEVCGMAADATEAAALATQLLPDLVLIDVRLRRGTDGIAAAAAIRAERPVPVVFCTAFAEDPSTRARLEAVGAAGVLAKPVRTEALRAAIERALAARES
jgi:two-component system, response regulator PdtaR